MRFSLFTFLLFLFQFASSQIIDLKKELFYEEGFFIAEEIANKKIMRISITGSDKRDGRFFREERPIYIYDFFENGKVASSKKMIPLSNRTDTVQFSFFYNGKGNLYKRTEEQGPFKFNYYFSHQENKIDKEIKIDANSPNFDTAYLRNYSYEEEANRLIASVLNSAGKAFKIQTTEWDFDNRLISDELRYTKTSNYEKTKYKYHLDFLTHKSEKSFFGKEKERQFSFKYKGYLIDLIELSEDGVLTEKFGFVYGNDKLPSAVVERNVLNKSVSIYRFTYEFYD